MINPICTQCQFFSFNEAQAAWSELTPGNEFGMECAKNKWSFDPHIVTAQDLEEIFLAGQSCGEFEQKIEEES